MLQAFEMSESTLDRWRHQYGGMKAHEAKRLKELEDENRQLKHIVAEQALDIRMLNMSRRELVSPSRKRTAVCQLREVRSVRANGVQGVESTAEPLSVTRPGRVTTSRN